MDRGNVFSAGAFRATLRATFAMIAVFLTTAIIGYRYLQEKQLGQSRARLQPVIEMFQYAYDTGGDAAVRAHLAKLSATPVSAAKVLSARAPSGEYIGGRFKLEITLQSWHKRSLVTDPASGEMQQFYLTSVQIGAHRFVMGEDLAPLERIEAIFIRTLMLIGALLSLVFIALGYGTSRSVQIKLEQLDKGLTAFAGGDTSDHLPVLPANDQIDRVSVTMNHQLDRLSRLMEDTKTGAAAIAHDLKRPLSRTMLEVEQALDLAEQGQPTQEALENIQTELANLGAIFESILRIARIDENHGDFGTDTVDLVALTRDIAETFQVVAEESGQSLALVLPEGDAPVIRGDAGMIAQMLANLLQNAVTHGTDGNRITLTLSKGPSGPALAAADRDKVFDAVYRADAARSNAGNGLGLTLVKSIADRHGAQITLADTAPGLSVTVQFTHA